MVFSGREILVKLRMIALSCTKLFSFTPYMRGGIKFDNLWTEEDERVLREDYAKKDLKIKDHFSSKVLYPWSKVEDDASHPEADYVWMLSYKMFQKSPYDLITKTRTGLTLELADKGICKLFTQVLCLPGIEGDVEFLHYILQYAANFTFTRCPKPKEYSGSSAPEHLHFMKVLLEAVDAEYEAKLKSQAMPYYRYDPDPFVVDNNTVANRQLLWTIIIAWTVYSEQEDLPTVTDYEHDVQQRLSSMEKKDRANVTRFKKAWEQDWPLEYRRHVIRKHQCRYRDVYRNSQPQDIVDFIENVTPERCNLKDSDENDSFYSIHHIINSIPTHDTSPTPMDVIRESLAHTNGREWQCFSPRNDIWAPGGLQLFQINIKMRTIPRCVVIGIGIHDGHPIHHIWMEEPRYTYLDHNGDYVDGMGGWYISKKRSEVVRACDLCHREVCCQIRRRWNGVFVRTVVRGGGLRGDCEGGWISWNFGGVGWDVRKGDYGVDVH